MAVQQERETPSDAASSDKHNSMYWFYQLAHRKILCKSKDKQTPIIKPGFGASHNQEKICSDQRE